MENQQLRESVRFVAQKCLGLENDTIYFYGFGPCLIVKLCQVI
jgi:hypothetical protein